MKRLSTLTLAALFAIAITVSVSATPVIFSDGELAVQFAKQWGPASVTVVDIPGPGARFDFTGLSSTSGTGVGDNWPVSQLAGGAWKDYGGSSGYYDFSGYTNYPLVVTNVGSTPVAVCVYMNTGWTVPEPKNDTYWQSAWTDIGSGDTKAVTLDFSSFGEVWNAEDELEFTQYTDGSSGGAVYRLDEVSHIGLQVLGDGDSSIQVEPVVGPEPATLILMIGGLLGLAGYAKVRLRRKNERKAKSL
jgi:hypothetical protein